MLSKAKVSRRLSTNVSSYEMHGELLLFKAAPGTMLGERLCVPSGKSGTQVETLRYQLIRARIARRLECMTKQLYGVRRC